MRISDWSSDVCSSDLALVYVDLPKDAGLTAGQFVEGAFETGQHAVLSVPESAIVLRDGHSYVMTLDAQHIVHQLKVTTGVRNGELIADRKSTRLNSSH